VSLKHVINLIMWIRDTGCHTCGRKRVANVIGKTEDKNVMEKKKEIVRRRRVGNEIGKGEKDRKGREKKKETT
jgi:hypothetical protein